MARSLQMVLVLAVAACTEPNPGYHIAPDAAKDTYAGECDKGQRRCLGVITQVCSGVGRWLNERRCPGLSSCKAGLCVPSGHPCDSEAHCGPGQACNIFVNPQSPKELATFCAQTVGLKSGLDPCFENDQCRSGFCLQRGAVSTCFRACKSADDCPDKASHKCLPVYLTVNGVQGQVKSCVNSK